MRLNRIGFYKEIGHYKEAEVSTYSNAMQIINPFPAPPRV